mmetsp:Transcript_18398/g.38630  ORF Transcript_18398/g.38630 Transcript_18398/m.38630 type:complete len:223 (-) Transcript_18398:85-753(-)
MLGLCGVTCCACSTCQISIFHLLRPHLGQNVCIAVPSEIVGTTRAQIDRTVGQSARGFICLHQSFSQIVCLFKEDIILTEVISRKESSETANGGFEPRNGTHMVVVEIITHPIASFVEFILHSHEPKGIEGVNQGSPHSAPIARPPLRNGMQLIHPKRILFIILPNVLHGPQNVIPPRSCQIVALRDQLCRNGVRRVSILVFDEAIPSQGFVVLEIVRLGYG